MEESKRYELYAEMLKIAEKYQGLELKDWRDDDRLLVMSIMDKLSEGRPRTIQTVVDDGTWANSEEGKKKLAELREKIFDKEFKLEADFDRPISAYLDLKPAEFNEMCVSSQAYPVKNYKLNFESCHNIEVYDMLVFEYEDGSIYQDCVCSLANDPVYIAANEDEEDEYFHTVSCNQVELVLDNEYNILEINEINYNGNHTYKLKEIWTRTDEDTYKKVWELLPLEEYESAANYFYNEYQHDINLGCDEVDLAKSRRAYEQAKKEYEQAKKVWENK